MSRRYVGRGAGELVHGDAELVAGDAQRVLQLDEAGVQPGEPLVHEAGELQPRIHRSAADGVLGRTGRRDGVQ